MKTPTPEDFLPLLENGPARAADLFCLWGYVTLAQAPPSILRTLNDDTRNDITQIILMHCIVNNCAILKKYDPQGGKFAGWFYRVAQNKTLSELKSRGMNPIGDDVEEHTLESAAQSANSPEYNDLVENIWRYITTLGEKCQRLLKLASMEYKPGEMTVVLGLKASENKQVSEDLRQCRKKLEAALETAGIPYGEIFHDL